MTGPTYVSGTMHVDEKHATKPPESSELDGEHSHQEVVEEVTEEVTEERLSDETGLHESEKDIPVRYHRGVETVDAC